MYYSLLVEFVNATGKKVETKRIIWADNLDLEKIEKEIVEPYLNNDEFIIDGYMLNRTVIKRIKIVSSSQRIKEIAKQKQDRLAPGIFYVYTEKDIFDDNESVTDITNDILKSAKQFMTDKERPTSDTAADNLQKNNNKVFIVYGRDKAVWVEVARFLERMRLEPIVLQEQANLGRTLIEKIEEYTDVGYGIVLYTPCDIGGLATEGSNGLKPRARQNVVFEHGYLLAKLGRDKVCALMKPDVEYPNDISGMLHVEYRDNDNWKWELAKEMKKSGLKVDMNLLVQN